MMRHIFTLVLLAVSVLCGTVRAEVKPNSLFSDNAVLQRGVPLPVWGTAKDGEEVTVEFAGQKVSTTAKDGKWMVKLAPLTVGEPAPMTIRGDNTVTLNNVLVGDVWVASGQSNMERQLGPRRPQPDIDNWQGEVAAANYPQIREYYVPEVPAFAPVTDVNSRWMVCSPGTVKDFTAVGYFFARDLHQAVKVPIGILFTAWGGTVAEAWTSGEALEQMADFKGAVAEIEDMAAGRKPADTRRNPNRPTVLYNGMIAPLLPFPIKGAIWYQGESNNGRARQYRELFPLLIADWRKNWAQGEFPFLFVQIAPFSGMSPQIREAQFLTLQKSPHTAMAVTTDVGDANNIHPSHKAPVGARLALAARALAYDEKIEYSGPLFDSMKVEGGRATLSFAHVGSGLMAKDGPLKGFVIAGADQKFVPAQAEIRGDQVVAWSDQVPNPVAVRYGWANVPDVNLFNKEGLPASPFRTDTESPDAVAAPAVAAPAAAPQTKSPNAANNLALGKPVQSSDPNTYGWAGGLTNGSWDANQQNAYATGNSPALPKTATIDLGQATTIGQVLLGVPPFGSTKTITVALSADGTNFTEVGAHVFAQNKEERYLYSFAPVAARYVRLTYPDRYDQAVKYPNTFAFTTEAEVFAPDVKVLGVAPATAPGG